MSVDNNAATADRNGVVGEERNRPKPALAA
jgi:hypothetical protein